MGAGYRTARTARQSDLSLFGKYPIRIKISDAELASFNLNLDKFHGDWNYSVLPMRKKT